ncbi:MAG: 16S rRNA (guanine(966)-N(2))-methyltransferase RsmD [Myxococcota bacterium]
MLLSAWRHPGEGELTGSARLRRTAKRSAGLRITGGRLGGRRLRAPRGGLRPTSDRVRESLFARLGDLSGVAVLDLYAGTGALGVEAVSRGADSLVCVEQAPLCLAALRANLAELGLGPTVRVIADDAVRAVRRLGRSSQRFDLVLMDPPYVSAEAPRALEALVEAGVLAEGATVVLESGRRHPVAAAAGLVRVDERRYGETVLTRWVAASGRSSGGRGDT